jgi:hypothetical protein
MIGVHPAKERSSHMKILSVVGPSAASSHLVSVPSHIIYVGEHDQDLLLRLGVQEGQYTSSQIVLVALMET